MKKITQKYVIKSPIQEVWQALTDPEIIDKWGGGPAKMSSEEGFEFELWGGDVYGKNIEVTPGKKLVQEWFGGKWDKPSIATFVLNPNGTGTKIDFSQVDVPDSEFSEIEQGWRDYYLGPLRDYLENCRT